MRYGIIAAMEEEMTALLHLMTNTTTEKIGQQVFTVGELNQQNVVLTRSGIGKTLASSATSILISHFHCELIINVGVAGGLAKNVKQLDMVISTATAQHDFDLRIFNYQKGQVPGFTQTIAADPTAVAKATEVAKVVANKYHFTVHQGLIVSGDQFIASQEQRQQIFAEFPQALAAEMESAAVGLVCAALQVPSVIIRCISDNADEEASLTFEETVQLAARNSQEVILEFLK